MCTGALGCGECGPVQYEQTISGTSERPAICGCRPCRSAPYWVCSSRNVSGSAASPGRPASSPGLKHSSLFSSSSAIPSDSSYPTNN